MSNAATVLWCWRADVSDAAQVQSMMQAAKEQFGGIDFVIKNAGILRDPTIAKMSLEEWQSGIDVNLTGVFHCYLGISKNPQPSSPHRRRSSCNPPQVQ